MAGRVYSTHTLEVKCDVLINILLTSLECQRNQHSNAAQSLAAV